MTIGRIDERLIWFNDQDEQLWVITEEQTNTVIGGVSLKVVMGVNSGDPEVAMVTLPAIISDRVRLLKTLAAELGIDVQFLTPRAVGVCVAVSPPFPDGINWHVAGDVYEGLTDEETTRAERMLEPQDGDSLNYLVGRILKENTGLGFGDVPLDPESACFFAYPRNEFEAHALADWINEKEWVV